MAYPDGLVALASEAGVLDVDPSEVVAKGRLQPGRMFLVDTAAGRIIEDDEIKKELADAAPYGDWLHAGLMHLDTLPDREHVVYTHDSVMRRQQTFGYTEEELKVLLAPMAQHRRRAGRLDGHGHADRGAEQAAAAAVRLLHPAVRPGDQPAAGRDPRGAGHQRRRPPSGPEANLLEPGPASCRQIVLPFPVIDNDELAKIVSIDEDGDLPGFRAVRVSGLYRVADGGDGLRDRLVEICRGVSEAIEDGVRILVLSDRDSTVDLAPIPSLLLTAVVHQHLIREQTRTQVALDRRVRRLPRGAPRGRCCSGFGAAAVNPYLAFESVEDLIATGALTGIAPAKAVRNYVKALGKGVLKIMSKMGISTVASYTGAQVFEAVGLDKRLVERYFTGTSSTIGGVGLTEIARRGRRPARHRVPGQRGRAGAPPARGRRRVPVAPRGRAAPVQPGDRVPAPARDPQSRQYDVFRQYTSTVDKLAAESGLPARPVRAARRGPDRRCRWTRSSRPRRS